MSKTRLDTIVRGLQDSRANLMPIYGDLYQIKLLGKTNENHLVTLLGKLRRHQNSVYCFSAVQTFMSIVA